MSNSKVVVSGDVIFTEFDRGEGVLVHLKGKNYFQVNETAMLVWKCLEHGKQLDEIVVELTAQFDVTTRHARESVSRLVDELEVSRLIRRIDV